MDFTYSDDQVALRDLAARILGERGADDDPRDGAYDAAAWRALAETGLLGLAIGTRWGGLGLGMIDFGLLLEEQGRTLARVPLIPSIVMGAMTIDRFGSDAQRRHYLPGALAGEMLLTAAIEEEGNADPARPATRAWRTGDRWVLSGTKTAVPYAAKAGAMLVSAQGETDAMLFLVDAAIAPAPEPQWATNGEPQGRFHFAETALPAAALLGEGSPDALPDLIARARIALAQRQVGVAAEALRRTAEYSSSRIQFGRPTGSMQAVQQRAADGFIDVEAMRSAALLAAWRYDQGMCGAAEAASAKYWAATGGHRVAHTAQHLHGGIGADISYPIHRYFLEAMAVGHALGGGMPMLAEIGRAIAEGRTEALA
ncbi:MAG: acyl-CoA dehydrogenase family protein [Sphingopyxis sp.]|uniref:acyl-CoA dehydrogenase family protein n=1 Tax=Sphingopyxis sp. TaxID=1908224 RepID=UPI0032ED1E8B